MPTTIEIIERSKGDRSKDYKFIPKELISKQLYKVLEKLYPNDMNRYIVKY